MRAASPKTHLLAKAESLTGCRIPAIQKPHTGRTNPVPARAGAVRCASVPVPPAACTDVLAPRRLRVPDLTTPTRQRARSGTLQLCYTSKQIAIARGAALGDENGWCVRCPPTPVCLGSMRPLNRLDAGVPALSGVPRLRREREYQCLSFHGTLRAACVPGSVHPERGRACMSCMSAARRSTSARTRSRSRCGCPVTGRRAGSPSSGRSGRFTG